MVCIIVVPGILYGLLWFAGRVSVTLAFWLAVVGFVWCSGFSLAWVWLQLRGKLYHQLFGDYFITMNSVASTVMLVWLLLTPESPVRDWFQNSNDESTQWLLFLADNVIRVVLLDVPEIFEIRMSTISAANWLSRLIVFLFRIFFALGILELGLALFRRRHQSNFYGTHQECWNRCRSLLGVGSVQVERLGVVQKLEAPAKIRVSTLSEMKD